MPSSDPITIGKPQVSRNLDTLSHDGTFIGIDEPRFAATTAIRGIPNWTATGKFVSANPSGGASALKAVGMDHNGETPILVSFDQLPANYRIFHGADLTLVRTISSQQIASAVNAPSGQSFGVFEFLVHHGMIVGFTSRSSGGEIHGVTVVVSQDLGANWSYVPAQGVTPTTTVGAGDVPDVPHDTGQPPTGILAPWCIGLFPERGLEDRKGVIFTWCDYQAKSGSPGGYQVGAFRARRTTGNWTIEPNRVLGELNVQNESGFHGHGCAPDKDGLVVVCGDVGYRNRIDRYDFDWETYATSAVTQKLEWYGGSDFDASLYRYSPQPTSPAPWQEGASVWSGDGDDALILKIGPGTDSPKIGIEYRQSSRRVNGASSNPVLIQLRFAQSATNKVWTGGSGINTHISTGETFESLASGTGSVFSDGNSLYRVNNYQIETSAIPARVEVNPISIADGGTNLIHSTWDSGVPLGNNTVKRVTFDGQVWRYDNNDVLVPQPKSMPPTFGPVYEFDCIDSHTMGRFSVGPTLPPGDRLNTERFNYIGLWVHTLGPEAASIEILPRVLYGDNSIRSNLLQGITWRVGANDGWYSCPAHFMHFPSTGARPQLEFYARFAGVQTRSRFLICADNWNTNSVQPTYPIRPKTGSKTVPEKLKVVIDAESQWSFCVSLIIPQNSGGGFMGPTNYFSLVEDSENYLEFFADEVATGSPNQNGLGTFSGLKVRAMVNGILSTVSFGDTLRPRRNDTIHFLATCDGSKIDFRLASPEGVFESTLQGSVSPVNLLSGDHEQSAPASVDFAAMGGWKRYLSTAEQMSVLRDLPFNTQVDNAVQPDIGYFNGQFATLQSTIGNAPTADLTPVLARLPESGRAPNLSQIPTSEENASYLLGLSSQQAAFYGNQQEVPLGSVLVSRASQAAVDTLTNRITAGVGSAGGSNGGDNSKAIADLVLAALRPTAASFRGARQLQELNSVSIVQRDDYVAADGRAFEWTVVNPAIDYTAATVLVGPVGGGTEPNAPTLLGTATLRDKLDGSCTLRIEFSAAQTNVAAGTYNLQAMILVSTRRITSAQIIVTVAPAYADAPPA